jgi:hypothetical protein
MPPKVGQRATKESLPNTPTSPPRPKSPDASTGPTTNPVRPAKAGPPKQMAETLRNQANPNANPLRATISDLNDPDRDE